MQKKLLILAGAVILLAISIKFFPYHCNCGPKDRLTIGDTTIRIDRADTPALRDQGLSGRTSLEDGTGMFFIFDKPAKYGFWMKDMNFSIDIVWIDSTKQIVSCDKSLTPDSYPKIFSPKSEVLYVLEVPAGFCDTHKIDTSSEISFES